MTNCLSALTGVLLVCLGPAATFGFAASDAPRAAHDPAFDHVPFDEWMAGPSSSTRIRWSVEVRHALSFHQRLVATVAVQVDGAELAHRRGKGEFVVFTQFTDAAGKSYQSHTAMDLSRAEEGLSASNAVFSTRAFVLPGEYRVAILLMNSANKEHWSKTEKVQFADLKHDPLPDSWKDLPPVEFVSHVEPPESWLLPAVPEHLNITGTTKGPVKIDVVVNLTTSERRAGSNRFRNETLEALIPTLKLLSEMKFGDATMNVALLDLSLHRVLFHRNKVRDLDWDTLKDAFVENSVDTIDVKSLEDRGRNAAFFVKEVSRRISADTPAGVKHVVIVLSGATSFESGEDLRPIEATPDHCPVFYVRYQVPVIRRMPQNRERGWATKGGYRGVDENARRVHTERMPEVDQLEKTLKPVEPRVFDVSDPEQMRKALGALRDEIEGL